MAYVGMNYADLLEEAMVQMEDTHDIPDDLVDEIIRRGMVDYVLEEASVQHQVDMVTNGVDSSVYRDAIEIFGRE